MDFKRHKFYLWLTIIMCSPNYTKGSCEMTELPKSDGLCVASLQCDHMITFELTSWNCIKHVRDYNYGYYRRNTQTITYDTDYKLFVSVNNVDDERDIFETVSQIKSNIIIFQINDGHMLALPQKVYQLSQATKIEISNIQLSAVDLNSFVSLTQLKEINLINNSISSINMDAQTESLGSRSIETIDLSHNHLETIPNNCFSHFTELKHLNLSHNKIRSFDILTFEGVRELTTLDVSHNMLLEIGNSFTRFINLEYLYLQNNQLTKIDDYNFSSLLKLRQLNLSSNIIDTFENNTFKSNTLLGYLDFSNNKIKNIQKPLFENNHNLGTLFIANNLINHIDDDVFAKNNITEFDLKNNSLTGNIDKNTFNGVHVAVLDLSKGTITSLGDEAFNHMCHDLIALNVSFNGINVISGSAFSCLELLTILDLSNNRLEELSFETTSLQNVSHLYVRNNSIKKITKNVYKNLLSLKRLDLSYNEITEIEFQSFVGLEIVDTLTVTHNPFVSRLENNTFNGLVALKSIDMSFTRTISFQNESFSGLPALKHINSSFGQLSNIAFNAFVQTGSIEKLDLSHNLLDVFYINSTSISNVEEIYLNDNIIRHVTNNTFSGLKFLRKLNLVNNNIQRMEAYALKDLKKLSHLYLSSNAQLEMIGSPFDNLTNLYQVNLDGIKTKFTFQNAISIDNLDLHSCGVSDLNKMSIFRVGDLRELNLSANKILKLDKYSLQSLPFLIELDLSLNRISFIQPGTFLQVSGLRKLTLFGNNLQTLQFGVFDGIKALHFVNLSSNALQSFDGKLLPVAISIALDNNNIRSLSFEDLFKSEIEKLSIGGNLISCKVLAELKSTPRYSEKFKKVVTTATLDFHSENVDGISCQSAPKDNGIISPVANDTGYDIRPMFIQFTNNVEKLRSSIESLGKNTTPEKNYEMKSDISKLVNSIQALVDISNKTQVKSEDYFKKMENISNATQIHLDDIKEQLINLTNKKIDLGLKHDYVKGNDNNDDIRTEMKRMLKDEMDAIREEFGKTYQNIQTRNPAPQAQVIEKQSKDITVLYVIAVSLGIIIVFCVINFVYSYLKRVRLNSLHSSRRPITSEMEME